MPRSVNAVASRARRKKILNRTKGYWGRGKNVWTVAKNKWEKGQTYAYRDRKNNGISYSVFMGELHKNNIELNRKVLADLAMNNPEAFSAVVKMVKK